MSLAEAGERAGEHSLAIVGVVELLQRPTRAPPSSLHGGLRAPILPALPEDDLRYVQDLGLVRASTAGGLVIGNPIYRKVIPRSLASGAVASLPQIQPTWLDTDGRIDEGRLLAAFLEFWRQHGEPLLAAAPYHEIAPPPRADGLPPPGGHRRRDDRARVRDRLRPHGSAGPPPRSRLAIELKVWRDGDSDPLSEGLRQLDRHLPVLGLERGWLVIFDRRAAAPRLADRTSSSEATTPGGQRVVVVRA